MPDRVDTKQLRELHRHHRECLCGLPHCAKCRDDEEFERQIDERLPTLLDAYDRCAAAERERDEARAQRDKLLDTMPDGAWAARALDAERELQRLRDGVRRIAKMNCEWDTEQPSWRDEGCPACIARALLDDEPEDPGE
jgi:hypothetical protein